LIAVNKFYYWPNLKKEVAEFMARCLDCLQVKLECKHLGGLLQPITIRELKWEVISMDFIIVILRTLRQHDYIMVMVDRLSKVAQFIRVKTTYSTSEVAQVFIREMVILNGVLKKIVSDRDENFTSKFWKEIFAALGTKLAFNTTYHLQTNGKT